MCGCGGCEGVCEGGSATRHVTAPPQDVSSPQVLTYMLLVIVTLCSISTSTCFNER